MKRIIPFVVALALLSVVYFYMNPLLPIITGYSAKNLASGIFVAGRTQESMEKEDLHFSFIKFNRNIVDTLNKEVRSNFLWKTSKAIYIDGFGCSLVNDRTKKEMLSRPYNNVGMPLANPDTIPWPMGDLVSDSIPSGVNRDKLGDALNQAFLDTIPFKGTFAVTVVYKGQIIAEKYRQDMKPSTKFLSWSMAKSFTNALVGILVKEGKLDINKPVKLTEWQNNERRNITISNLMHMNSGLEWNEDYGNNSDVNIMLHKKGDMALYTLEKPLVVKPDSIWSYSSGSTNIVSKIIRNTIGNDAEYYSFPGRVLFNRIGMRSAVWEIDASGTFVGSSYIYATMRDYARFGLLYLNNGKWLNEQILPEGWVEYTRSEAKGSNGQYGAFFWLNKSAIEYPEVPLDMYCCRGHNGQYIYIIPSKKLVVVRTGFSKKGSFDLNRFLSSIVNSVD